MTPKGTRPPGARTWDDDRTYLGPPPEDEPELIVGLRRALRTGHPLDFLAQVSTLLTVTDPRGRGPFEPEPTGPERDELVGTFLEVDIPETTALLTAWAVLIDDEMARARIDRELGSRRQILPAWLTSLAEARVTECWEMVHVLGDGDNVMVGVRLANGDDLCAVVYIDHNMGTLVKDAFMIPDTVDAVVDAYKAAADHDPDTTWRPIDPADARARITKAIELGAMTFPPFETETWPSCRPLVEWVARLLPEGGTGYQWPEWPEERQQALADAFFASPFGVGLAADDDHRSLLGSLLWFGTGYGPGDPMRWSGVAVEIVLIDWVPRKLLLPVAELAKVPDLLRAFIRYCHAERGIRAELTEETLAAVDAFEPEYQQLIRSDRPQGPAALLARMGVGDGLGGEEWDDEWDDGWDDDYSVRDIMLESLERQVGGRDVLDRLDAEPLPDEPFDWTGIPDDIHDRVGDYLRLVDDGCEHFADVEYRTACRRFLARAAAGDPAIFRRKSRTESGAAAVVWIIGKANDLFNRIYVADLAEHFGVPSASLSQRAETLRKAVIGERAWDRWADLGDPSFLVSAKRARMLELKARYEALDD